MEAFLRSDPKIDTEFGIECRGLDSNQAALQGINGGRAYDGDVT